VTREVFVSYSKPDQERAYELVERIEARGFKVWVAPRDVSPSADWAAEIIEAISAPRVMVLVFSASSNESPQVRREVERAVHKQLRVLAFRLEDVLPSHSLEYFLSSQHWMDAFPAPYGPHYDRLCSVLARVLSEPPGTTAPVPTPLDPAQLRQVEAEFARFMGPIAGHLVRKAAAACTNVDELARRLAEELDPEQDRRQFTAVCRQHGWISR
jgi:TIR domain-containing protein